VEVPDEPFDQYGEAQNTDGHRPITDPANKDNPYLLDKDFEAVVVNGDTLIHGKYLEYLTVGLYLDCLYEMGRPIRCIDFSNMRDIYHTSKESVYLRKDAEGKVSRIMIVDDSTGKKRFMQVNEMAKPENRDTAIIPE
jgi:hypothetical protein